MTEIRSTTNLHTSSSGAIAFNSGYYPYWDKNEGILDLTYGGQQGYSPVLGEWVSNQAYVRRQLIPIVLEVPEMFSILNGASDSTHYWDRTLKAIMELHCRTIDGFSSGLKVEVGDHPFGGGGELQQEPVDVKRERSVPKFSFVEKTGLPIQTFFQYWIEYGIMCPESKYALINTVENGPENLLPSWYTMTMLFIEPDATHKRVVKSWLTTNMFPMSNGDVIGKRDLTSASEILVLDIEFTGITQVGVGVNVLAQKIMDTITMTNANPFFRPAFLSGAASGISALKGYVSGANFLASNRVQTGSIVAATGPVSQTYSATHAFGTETGESDATRSTSYDGTL